jgi:hypothetical protein
MPDIADTWCCKPLLGVVATSGVAAGAATPAPGASSERRGVRRVGDGAVRSAALAAGDASRCSQLGLTGVRTRGGGEGLAAPPAPRAPGALAGVGELGSDPREAVLASR